VISPFIVELGSYDPSLPTAIFGAIMLASSVVFLFTPETRGKPLTQTTEDMDNEGSGEVILSTKTCFGR